MSVICKSKESVQGMTGGLLYYLASYREVLTASSAFQGVKKWIGDEGNPEEVFIYWLMSRMWVANKVAYAIQYGETVTLREEIPDVVPTFVEPSELVADLRNFNYNIYTNGGQCWMDHQWHSAFQEITDCIKEIPEKKTERILYRVV